MKKGFSLKEYSILASAFIAQGGLKGEVIYTDIPDVIIDHSYEEYHMDIDGNGTEDFRFIKFSGTYIWSSYSGSTELRFFNDIRVDLFNSTNVFSENQIAGISVSTYYSYLRYWPYTVPSGALVSNELQFQNGFVQHMASGIDPLPLGGGVIYSGYWWPSMEDHFLGVHFIDADSNYHYGWIRCSVLDSAEVLIIKDYAYETEIEHPIVAGDTISYVGINDEPNTLVATVYSYGKNVYLTVNNPVNTRIAISDLNGKVIIEKAMEGEDQTINMFNYPAGIYLVTIFKDNKQFSKEVFIE